MPIKEENQLGLDALARPRKAEKPLDPLALKIHAFLLRKIGYIRKPQAVPLNYIIKSNGCTLKQARIRIKQLQERGYIERWTTKHNTHFKQTYYRIPYLTYNKIGYNKKLGMIIPEATYAPTIGVSAYSKELKNDMLSTEKIVN